MTAPLWLRAWAMLVALSVGSGVYLLMVGDPRAWRVIVGAFVLAVALLFVAVR